MFAENRKISLRQLQALLLLDGFGTAALFLPAELAAESGRACWVTAACAGAGFALLSLLLTAVGRRMPAGTVVEWCEAAFGRGIGAVLCVGLGLQLLVLAAAELRLFSEIVCRAMLPATPVWAIALVVLAVAAALAAQGTECRGRTAEVLFFAVVVPLVLVLLAAALSARYGRVLPLALPPVRGLMSGVRAVSLLFGGLLFLYFVFPALQKPREAPRAVLHSSLLSAALLTAAVFLSLAVYGADTLPQKLLPTLQMLERVSFTGVFLTRQDMLLLWFWMASVSVFLSGVLFFGSLLGVRLLRQKERRRKGWLFVWAAAVLAAAFLPENMAAAYRLRLAIVPYGQAVYLLLLPLALLLAGRKGGRGV